MDPLLEDGLPFDDEASPIFNEEAVLLQLEGKQDAFVAEYLKDLNVGKAAVRAGYKPSSAGSLTRNPSIVSRIIVAKAQRAERCKMEADAVLLEMSLLSHSRINHYKIDEEGNVSLEEGAPEGAMAAIQSIKRKVTSRTDKAGETTTDVTVELKLWDKTGPLKLMGRHVGLFPDRMEHTGPGGGPIETITKIERVIVDPLPQEHT